MSRDARPNRVLVSLMSLGLLTWLGLDALSVAPNRLVQGTPLSPVEALGWMVTLLGAMFMACVVWLAWHPSSARLWTALGLVTGLLVAMPLWLSGAVVAVLDPDMPQARVGIGPGLWVLLFLWLLVLVELRIRLRLRRVWVWSLLLFVIAIWGMALSQWLTPLALVQEYQARSEQFLEAVLYHLALVGAAVGASLLIGLGMALAMRRFDGLRRLGFGVLNSLQTIPSLALFGLLLAPLAWLGNQVQWLGALGVSGIGWAPAWLALVAYSLLPMVRNTYVALEGVDPGVIESARGMGMSPVQVFFQVRLPLALPVMLEGIRITTVQAIGLTAVAALIGAGGLGTFIFQGLGQAAMDLVLLGALPIIAMALVADALLGALAERLRRREAT
ncbi:ABC transporter permease [Ectothiorhodospira variabilis]|uniref:ABC transporter permease n=1 Tax=Ectothiorhodospira variabilis TaxID=505694 RepID=UPI001EFBB2B7|nr:ABC transporter permease [Ectothiorhodospira variabilis]MCG5498380.1 ABC transporter permease [Ectothiorhodospira variabilis]